LFGANSYAANDLTNTGLDSGLDTGRSDYVARLSYQPNSTYKFASRFRFDHDTFAVQRMELETVATFSRWNLSLMYGEYAAQPDIGYTYQRQGILGTALYKLDTNWVLSGGARYDLTKDKFNQTRIGVGYIDDCLILGLNYLTNYNYDVVGNPTLVHQVMLQLSLRTLGNAVTTSNVGSPTTP